MNSGLLAHVMRWKTAEPLLDAERRERIRNADTRAFIEMTSRVFAAQVRSLPARLDSGLIIQQSEFRKAAKP
jgi:hypothetical protein